MNSEIYSTWGLALLSDEHHGDFSTRRFIVPSRVCIGIEREYHFDSFKSAVFFGSFSRFIEFYLMHFFECMSIWICGSQHVVQTVHYGRFAIFIFWSVHALIQCLF